MTVLLVALATAAGTIAALYLVVWARWRVRDRRRRRARLAEVTVMRAELAAAERRLRLRVYDRNDDEVAS